MELKSVYSKMFLWMAIGLAVTFATGYVVSINENMLVKIFSGYGWIICSVLEIGLVIALSAFIRKMSPLVASICFIVYSFITGLTFGGIFIVYELSSIIFVFGVTAVLFLIFALIGHFTNMDLTKLGTILLMALLGVIVCSIINIFLKSEGFDLGITILALVIFLGYIAYDIQVIKKNLLSFENADKLAIYGALQLYLDFINLMIRLLKLIGKQRD